MDPEDSQRRRLIIALVVTTLLVPAYYVLERAQNNPANAETPGATTVPEDDDDDNMMGTIPIGYLDGPSIDDDGDSPTIVVPESIDVLTTRATFDRNIRVVQTCLVPGAPKDAKVTIVNTENGLSVSCNNVLNPDNYADRAYPDDAVLSLGAYQTIGDLTDAPLPIEAYW